MRRPLGGIPRMGNAALRRAVWNGQVPTVACCQHLAEQSSCICPGRLVNELVLPTGDARTMMGRPAEQFIVLRHADVSVPRQLNLHNLFGRQLLQEILIS